MAEQSTLSGRIARFAKVGANLGGFAAGAAVARAGGIGVVHKNMSIDRQAAEVDRVKRSESGMILNPITLSPDALLRRPPRASYASRRRAPTAMSFGASHAPRMAPNRAAGHKEQDMPHQEQSPNAAPNEAGDRCAGLSDRNGPSDPDTKKP